MGGWGEKIENSNSKFWLTNDLAAWMLSSTFRKRIFAHRCESICAWLMPMHSQRPCCKPEIANWKFTLQYWVPQWIINEYSMIKFSSWVKEGKHTHLFSTEWVCQSSSEPLARVTWILSSISRKLSWGKFAFPLQLFFIVSCLLSFTTLYGPMSTTTCKVWQNIFEGCLFNSKKMARECLRKNDHHYHHHHG